MDYILCVIDVSSILECSEDDTTAAAIVLLYSLLCSETLLAYSSVQSATLPHSLLEQFVIFHHLLYFAFAGDTKVMSSVIGAGAELLVLSSDKNTKNSEKAITDLLMKFEDGFDEEITARNQLREVLGQIFIKRSGKSVSTPALMGGYETLFSSDVQEK